MTSDRNAPAAEAANCVCDWSSYYTAEANAKRAPFIVNADCPVHAAPAVPAVDRGAARERRDEWRRLAEAATEGPWEVADTWRHRIGSFDAVCITDGPYDLIACYGGSHESSEEREAVAKADAAFIAACRTAVPVLVAEVEALEAERDALRDAALRTLRYLEAATAGPNPKPIGKYALAPFIVALRDAAGGSDRD